MPRISFWNSGRKDNNYNFLDHHIKQVFLHGGTAVYLHKYLGPHDQEGMDVDGERDKTINSGSNVTKIQDLLFLENRDRKYSKEIFELRGVYNTSDLDFDLRSQGLFLTNDVIYVEFHLSSIVESIGRKIVSGDVVEFPHQREFYPLDPLTAATNRFYSVTDVSYSGSGYAANWWPYILRVKCEPLTDSQEFRDILDKTGTSRDWELQRETLRSAMSNFEKMLEINETVVEQANVDVPKRYAETRQFYLVPGDNKDYPWVYSGDGIPPNGAELLDVSESFPENAPIGSWVLRSDYPDFKGLFQKTSIGWILRELEYRIDWLSAHRKISEIVQNTDTYTDAQGNQIQQKQGAHKVGKLKKDNL